MELPVPKYIIILKNILMGQQELKNGYYIKVFEPFVSIQEIYFFLNEEYDLNIKIEKKGTKNAGYEIYQLIPDYFFLFHNKTNGDLLIIRDDNKIILFLDDNAEYSVTQAIINHHGLKGTYSSYYGDFAVEYYLPGRGAIKRLRDMSWEKEKAEVEVKNKVYPIECLARVKGDYGWFLIDKGQYARFVESVAKDSYKLIEKLI